jgi:hypothetical protein
MAAIRHLPQHIKWLIAATLLASLAFVLTAQFAVPNRNDDGSLRGNVLVVKESDADDLGKLFDGDLSLAALPASELVIPARPASTYSTSHYLTAAYLVTFIIAPARAPPHARYV